MPPGREQEKINYERHCPRCLVRHINKDGAKDVRVIWAERRVLEHVGKGKQKKLKLVDRKNVFVFSKEMDASFFQDFTKNTAFYPENTPRQPFSIIPNQMPRNLPLLYRFFSFLAKLLARMADE